MFKSLSEFFIKRSTGWVALASLVIFLSFSVLVLPRQSTAVEAYSGGLGSPDLSLFYTPDDLYHMAETYGPAGRAAYIRARFTFDLLFPFVYGAFLTACLGWLLGRTTEAESRWHLLVLAPLLGVLFDFLENISATFVIGRFPLRSPIAAYLAPVFTAVKWVFVSGSFIALAVLFAIFVLKKLNEK